MEDAGILETPEGRRIAWQRVSGAAPGLVFLGGLRSDMTGTKAAHLHGWAARRGRAFLRFDYSGHGSSGGRFEEGTIGAWAQDARAAIDALTTGPQVLVGSSMGGWIALLLARAAPERVAGLVGIAAAPDFTDALGREIGAEGRARLAAGGQVRLASEYGDPLPISRALLADGRRNRVLRAPLHLPFPVRLLQGEADRDVPVATALRLFAHATGPDIRLTLVKGADHRFSSAACLALIEDAITETLAGALP